MAWHAVLKYVYHYKLHTQSTIATVYCSDHASVHPVSRRPQAHDGQPDEPPPMAST